jgi:hypothetical protein
MALWEKQTRQFYEKVPVIRYGDLFGLRGGSAKAVKGFDREQRAHPFLQRVAREVAR